MNRNSFSKNTLIFPTPNFANQLACIFCFVSSNIVSLKNDNNYTDFFLIGIQTVTNIEWKSPTEFTNNYPINFPEFVWFFVTRNEEKNFCVKLCRFSTLIFCLLFFCHPTKIHYYRRTTIKTDDIRIFLHNERSPNSCISQLPKHTELMQLKRTP